LIIILIKKSIYPYTPLELHSKYLLQALLEGTNILSCFTAKWNEYNRVL